MEPSKETKLFLSELRENPLFQKSMQEVRQCFRPVVPAYKPGESQEETFSLMERIKYESGRKEGFDLMYLLLTGDKA